MPRFIYLLKTVSDANVSELLIGLENVVCTSCDTDIVSNATNDIGNVMLDAAIATFGTYLES